MQLNRFRGICRSCGKDVEPYQGALVLEHITPAGKKKYAVFCGDDCTYEWTDNVA